MDRLHAKILAVIEAQPIEVWETARHANVIPKILMQTIP
jgi:hypothetical protein